MLSYELGKEQADGGGLLIFGILVLPAEHDPLKFFSQPTKFVFVLGILDAFQAKMKCLF